MPAAQQQTGAATGGAFGGLASTALGAAFPGAGALTGAMPTSNTTSSSAKSETKSGQIDFGGYYGSSIGSQGAGISSSALVIGAIALVAVLLVRRR